MKNLTQKPFQKALQRMNLKPSELRIVENSLGVEGFRRKTVNLIQEAKYQAQYGT